MYPRAARQPSAWARIEPALPFEDDAVLQTAAQRAAARSWGGALSPPQWEPTWSHDPLPAATRLVLPQVGPSASDGGIAHSLSYREVERQAQQGSPPVVRQATDPDEPTIGFLGGLPHPAGGFVRSDPAEAPDQLVSPALCLGELLLTAPGLERGLELSAAERAHAEAELAAITALAAQCGGEVSGAEAVDPFAQAADTGSSSLPSAVGGGAEVAAAAAAARAAEAEADAAAAELDALGALEEADGGEAEQAAGDEGGGGGDDGGDDSDKYEGGADGGGSGVPRWVELDESD
eukprot:1913928-Prymnesium_polylepis.1